MNTNGDYGILLYSVSLLFKKECRDKAREKGDVDSQRKYNQEIMWLQSKIAEAKAKEIKSPYDEGYYGA